MKRSLSVIFMVAALLCVTPVGYTPPVILGELGSAQFLTANAAPKPAAAAKRGVTDVRHTGSSKLKNMAGSAFSGLGSALKNAAWIGVWVLLLAAMSKMFGVWVLSATASAFNYALDMTVGKFGTIPYINVSIIQGITPIWETMRDIANITLLFMFIFIAFMTILGNHTYNIKNLTGRVIIVALLVNFSLFFSKAVIDVGNFFGYQFYKSIQTVAVQGVSGIPQIPAEKMALCKTLADGLNKSDISFGSFADSAAGYAQYIPFVGGALGQLYSDTTTSEADKKIKFYEETCGESLRQANVAGVAGSILDALSLTSLYNGQDTIESAASSGAVSGLAKHAVNHAIAFVAFLIVAALFFYAAALLIIRMIVLIFIMIISPLAFVAAIVPKFDKFFSDWKQSLIAQSFFAPALIILLWAVLQIVRVIPTKSFSNGVLTQGGWVTFGLFTLNYLIVLGLFVGSIFIARFISQKLQDQAFGLSGKLAGLLNGAAGFAAGTPFRGAANGYRELSMRRASAAVEKESAELKRLQASPEATRAQIDAQKKALEKVSKRLQGTGDFRADNGLAKLLQKAGVNMGTAAKDSMEKTIKDRDKADSQYAKERAAAIGDAIKKATTEEETTKLSAAESKFKEEQKRLDDKASAFEKAVGSAKVGTSDQTGDQLKAAIQTLASQKTQAEATQQSLKEQLAATKGPGQEVKSAILKKEVDAKAAEIAEISRRISDSQKSLDTHIDDIARKTDPSVLKDIRDSVQTTAEAATAQRELQPRNREEQQLRERVLREKQAAAIRNVFTREGLGKYIEKGVDWGTKDSKGRSREENMELTTAARKAQLERANRPPTPPPQDKPKA